MPEEFYHKDFPNLEREGWERTSEPDNYNCISLVAGDHTRYWWPNVWHPAPPFAFWPIERYDLSLDNFVQALAKRGFSVSPNDDGRFEPGVQKAALYMLGQEIQHGALQQPNGKWRSKLGPHEDIETTLDGVAGPLYGSAVAILRRPNANFRELPKRTILARVRSCICRIFRAAKERAAKKGIAPSKLGKGG
jgi:hypothetical protein